MVHLYQQQADCETSSAPAFAVEWSCSQVLPENYKGHSSRLMLCDLYTATPICILTSGVMNSQNTAGRVHTACTFSQEVQLERH